MKTFKRKTAITLLLCLATACMITMSSCSDSVLPQSGSMQNVNAKQNLQLKLVVNVKTPGTLYTEINKAGVNDPLTVTDLTLSGTLNSSDLLLLRQMMGADQRSGQTTNGQLRNLDISKVGFIRDGSIYYYYTDKNVPYFITDSTTLPSYMFAECDLNTVNLPTNIKSFGIDVFYKCAHLSSIAIPTSVTSITNQAFYGCSSLSNLTIPANITTVGVQAFYGCSYLSNLTISEGVKTIENYAFSGCRSLSNVTIPNTMTIISDGTFSECTSLVKVTIPSSITCIDSSAFANCKALPSITIPSSVTKIAFNAFLWCNFTNVVIPESVKEIGDKAFLACQSLASVTIPANIKSIGKSAFFFCPKLTKVTMEAKNPSKIYVGTDCFNVINPDAILFVPKGCVDAYKSSAFAQYFKPGNIKD